MKLFLSSLAISDNQAPYLVQLVGKNPDAIKLALIENAADTYGQNHRQWVIDNRKAIQSHGFSVDIIDIREYKDKLSELERVLGQKDIIWFGGGNTYYLRWLLKETGIDQLLIKLIDSGIVYGGGSAGAIIAGPTLKHFETADDPAGAPAIILDGLHLTESVVVPHMDNPKLASVIQDINDKLLADGFKTVPLDDEQAFILNEAEEQII